MEHLRILGVGNVYPPHILGGYEIVWRGVTESLRAADHEVRVLTTDYRQPGIAPDAPDDPGVHRELRWYWREHAWPRMGPSAVLRVERFNAEVFDRHLDRFDPHVIAWWPMGGMSLSLIERARRRDLPAVLFVHDYWPNYGPIVDRWTRFFTRFGIVAPLAERLTGLTAASNLPSAGRWLFNSDSVRQAAARAGIEPVDAAILSPGIERALLDAPAEAEPPEWRWRLLYIGRIVEQKGVHVAVEALARLPEEATLRIIGEGDDDYAARLRALADSLGLGGRVTFEPPYPRPELTEVYRSADVIVFPVIWDEPWGLVPLEAMALGRPVVATGRGGSADFLVDGDNALLVATEDADGLADAVARIAADDSLRARLRASGRETAALHSEEAFNAAAVDEILRAATTAAANVAQPPAETDLTIAADPR